MTTTEIFLIAMLLIFSVPWLAWRLLRTDYWAPLVVVQSSDTFTAILLMAVASTMLSVPMVAKRVAASPP